MSAPAVSRVSRYVAPAIPKLRLVTAPARKRRMPFVLTCMAILALGLVGVLLVNISLSHTSYEISSLEQKQQHLHDEKQRLTESLSYKNSPQNLAKKARSLGMVPQRKPVYLMLDDGRIAGGKKKKDVLPKSATGHLRGPLPNSRDAVRPNLSAGTSLPPIGGKNASRHHSKHEKSKIGNAKNGTDDANGASKDGALKDGADSDGLPAPTQRDPAEKSGRSGQSSRTDANDSELRAPSESHP